MPLAKKRKQLTGKDFLMLGVTEEKGVTEGEMVGYPAPWRWSVEAGVLAKDRKPWCAAGLQVVKRAGRTEPGQLNNGDGVQVRSVAAEWHHFMLL